MITFPFVVFVIAGREVRNTVIEFAIALFPKFKELSKGKLAGDIGDVAKQSALATTIATTLELRIAALKQDWQKEHDEGEKAVQRGAPPRKAYAVADEIAKEGKGYEKFLADFKAQLEAAIAADAEFAAQRAAEPEGQKRFA